jgi:YVTN family beta-propeller protein
MFCSRDQHVKLSRVSAGIQEFIRLFGAKRPCRLDSTNANSAQSNGNGKGVAAVLYDNPLQRRVRRWTTIRKPGTIMKTLTVWGLVAIRAGVIILLAGSCRPVSWAQNTAGGAYQIYVTNERSDDLTVIDGTNFKVTATIPVGKRPRGIHASPDGKTIYVALSGTPVQSPPQLDEHGNPILKGDDDDSDLKADKAADGIALVDVAQRKFLRKISAGSDPEEFALSADGKQLYVSNEDVGTASVLNIESGKVEHIIVVGREPEGAGASPDGSTFYITCETGGDVFVIDAKGYKVIAHMTVNPRPRSIDFLPDGTRAFVPSESVGELNVVDSVDYKVLKTIKLPEHTRPMKVRVAPGGKTVYVSGGRSGTVVALDTATYEVQNTIKVGTRPWGLAISPDGKYLFAANGPSNDISVVDLTANKEIMRVKAGTSPWGIEVVSNAR